MKTNYFLFLNFRFKTVPNVLLNFCQIKQKLLNSYSNLFMINLLGVNVLIIYMRNCLMINHNPLLKVAYPCLLKQLSTYTSFLLPVAFA